MKESEVSYKVLVKWMAFIETGGLLPLSLNSLCYTDITFRCICCSCLYLSIMKTA